MKGMIVGQTYRPLSDFVWLCQLDEMNGMIVGQTYRPLSDFVWLCCPTIIPFISSSWQSHTKSDNGL
jgi:hypothetical protein